MIPYYYPIIDPKEIGSIKIRKRLPIPQFDNFFYFLKSTKEVNLYFDKFPIYLDTGSIIPFQKAVQVGLAICIIPEQIVIKFDSLNLSDQNDWVNSGNVTFFGVDIRYNRNIFITDVVIHKLTKRSFVKKRPKRRSIGT